MLDDLSVVYSATLNECVKIPKTGLRLSNQFIVAYTNYINSTTSVPGGYVAVEFDVGSAVLTSAPSGTSDSVITCISAYGFAVAHCLTPLMNELAAYKARVDQIFSGCSKPDADTLLKEVRKIPANPTAMAKLENLLLALPVDEQILVRKFVTDYSWWHGQKGIERDDFMYSPMLSCSRLVAASNGAIPTITKHFSAAASLYSAFKFSIAQKCTVMNNQMSQLITYGAPGTGKSHKIDECTNEANSIRVTFHPDTDYAAFVGAYKPTMASTDKGLLTLQELGTILQSLKDRGETRPEQKLGAEFWRSFEKLTPADVKSILENDSMYAEVMKGVAVGEYLTRIENGGKQVVYSFVPQAFMKAYVEAWRRYANVGLDENAKTFYLIIEEINRGNCAQIFGDLFQLLDRADNGFSAYAISPDDDIQKFLEQDKDYKLADIPLTEDVKKTTESGEKVIATVADIKTGKKLVLPPNLCIWATMNTSDQSLFPIDSAFKRRWEWEYVPIEDAGKGWKIDVDGVKYKWWSFLEKINDVIASETSSEDKQLGYFFVKAKGDVIDAKTFVSNVIFYLWGDVFKDNLPDEDAFKYTFKKDDKDEKRHIRFADFYHQEGDNTKEQWRDKLLASFLDALAVEKDASSSNAPGQGSANTDGGVAEADE